MLIFSSPNAHGFKAITDNFRGKYAGNELHINMLAPICLKRLIRNNKFKLEETIYLGYHIPYLNIKLTFPEVLSGVNVYVCRK